jgi:hypothetical protein
LIPIAWFAVVTFFMTVCRMAARGDAAPAPLAGRSSRATIDGVVIWEDPPDIALQVQDNRVRRARRRITAHGAR